MCDMICTNAVEFLEIFKFLTHFMEIIINQPVFFNHIMKLKNILNHIKYTYTIQTTICIKKNIEVTKEILINLNER